MPRHTYFQNSTPEETFADIPESDWQLCRNPKKSRANLEKYTKVPGYYRTMELRDENNRILAFVVFSSPHLGQIHIDSFTRILKGFGAKLLQHVIYGLNYDILWLEADWSEGEELRDYYRRPEFGFNEEVQKMNDGTEVHHFYRSNVDADKTFELVRKRVLFPETVTTDSGVQESSASSKPVCESELCSLSPRVSSLMVRECSRELDEQRGFTVVSENVRPRERYRGIEERFAGLDFLCCGSDGFYELAVATRIDESERIDEAWFKTYPVEKLKDCIAKRYPGLELEIVRTGDGSSDAMLAVHYPDSIPVPEIQRMSDDLQQCVGLCGYYRAHIAKEFNRRRMGYDVVVTYEYRHSGTPYRPHGLLYHVTPLHNLQTVLKFGISPRGRIVDGNGNGREGDKLSNRANFAYPNRIYLFKHFDLRFFTMYLKNGDKKNRTGKDTFDRKFVVLSIRPNDDMTVVEDPMFNGVAVYTIGNIRSDQIVSFRVLEYDDNWNLVENDGSAESNS